MFICDLCGPLFTKAEVATRLAFHDRPSPHQFDVGIEPGRHRVIAAAMDKRADVREPQLLIDRGTAASRHVEVEAVLRPLDHIDFHAAAGSPYVIGDPLQGSKAAAKTLRPLLSLLARKAPDCG